MARTDYELWDNTSGKMLVITNNKHEFIDLLHTLFDEPRSISRLDNLVVMVYNAEQDTVILAGAEEIEEWLTKNE